MTIKLLLPILFLTSCAPIAQRHEENPDYIHLWVKRSAVKYDIDKDSWSVPLMDTYFNLP